MSLVLLSLAVLCRSTTGEQTLQCGSETGPSPEWMMKHALTPGDLRELQVELVKNSVSPEEYSVLMNISWVLRADASILFLKATKICVTGKSNFQWYSCVRCNYTEAFEWQTRPSGGKWTFSYMGFTVAPSTRYFIGTHNIPNANMNEDGPSLSVNFTSPGCLDHIMKYNKKCIEAGSLWDPNITACKKNEKTVEVNFTTSSLGNRYLVLVQRNSIIGFSNVSENIPTRTSVIILVTGESEGAVVQLTPYFHTCGNDCIRRKGTVVFCPQTGVIFPLNNDRSMLGGWLPLLLSLLMVTWMLAVGIYLMWKRVCDSTCGHREGCPTENSQGLFPLAFNLFCGDLSSQTHLQKYVVVYFRGADTKDDYSALRVCPAFHLMKDAAALRTELLCTPRHVPVGKQSEAGTAAAPLCSLPERRKRP